MQKSLPDCRFLTTAQYGSSFAVIASLVLMALMNGSGSVTIVEVAKSSLVGSSATAEDIPSHIKVIILSVILADFKSKIL